MIIFRPDARGLIVGITQKTSKAHLCHAALEAVSFQTRDVLEAMQSDSKYELSSLLVDGGKSHLLIMSDLKSFPAENTFLQID